MRPFGRQWKGRFCGLVWPIYHSQRLRRVIGLNPAESHNFKGAIMKNLLLTSVSALALFVGNSANAADLERPILKAPPMAAPPPSWTGCHVGAHVGWGWGRTTIDQSLTNAQSSFGGGPAFDALASTGIDTSGAIFGAQVGCDYQFAGTWVFGVEGMFAATDINGVGSDQPFDAALQIEPGTTNNNTLRSKTDWLASATARLGYAGWLPDTLVYVKGGAAWMHDRYDFTNAVSEFANEGVANGLVQTTYFGWTIGAGWEWRLAKNWTAFVEYNHYQFESKNLISFTDDNIPASVYNMTGKPRIDTVKIGVNYQLWR
jgi:outer membrane immunogenic protein